MKNAIIYLNENNEVNYAVMRENLDEVIVVDIQNTDYVYIYDFKINQKYLIVGLIFNYQITLLPPKEMPLTPIERYLFNRSNVDFTINKSQYRMENIVVEFSFTERITTK